MHLANGVFLSIIFLLTIIFNNQKKVIKIVDIYIKRILLNSNNSEVDLVMINGVTKKSAL